jgi:hypothetical protein
VLLAGCGGGGGGGGGSTPQVVVPDGARVVAASADSDVSVENYPALSSPMVRALLGGVSGNLLDPTSAGRAAFLAAGDVGVRAPTLVGRATLAWLGRLPDLARKQAAAVSSQTLACLYGGTMTVSADDADNDSKISTGDTIGFFATNCVEDPSLPSINGGFTMVINAVELNSQDEPTALDVSATFQAFTLAGYGTLNGGFRLWTRPESDDTARLRISYLGATVSEVGGTVVYDFDIDAREGSTGGSYEISGGIGIGGRTYALSTPARMTYRLGEWPSSGSTVMRDAVGDAMRVVARSASSFDLEFLPAGSTVPTASQPGLLWADYQD